MPSDGAKKLSAQIASGAGKMNDVANLVDVAKMTYKAGKWVLTKTGYRKSKSDREWHERRRQERGDDEEEYYYYSD